MADAHALGRPDEIRIRDALRLLPDVMHLLRRLATERSMPRGQGETT